MSRNRLVKTLLTATACGGMVWGQAANPTPPLEARLGKVITVQEVNHPAEKCVIMQVWRAPEGNPVMQARCVQSGKLITIVEHPGATGSDRFRVFHWGPNGEPPQGCPLPPDMASKHPVGSESRAAAQKAWPAAHAVAPEAPATKDAEAPAAKETESPAPALAAAMKEVTKESIRPLVQPKVSTTAEKGVEPEQPAVKPAVDVKPQQPEIVVLKPTATDAKPKIEKTTVAATKEPQKSAPQVVRSEHKESASTIAQSKTSATAEKTAEPERLTTKPAVNGKTPPPKIVEVNPTAAADSAPKAERAAAPKEAPKPTPQVTKSEHKESVSPIAQTKQSATAEKAAEPERLTTKPAVAVKPQPPKIVEMNSAAKDSTPKTEWAAAPAPKESPKPATLVTHSELPEIKSANDKTQDLTAMADRIAAHPKVVPPAQSSPTPVEPLGASPYGGSHTGAPGHLAASPYGNEGSTASKSAPQVSSAYGSAATGAAGGDAGVRRTAPEITPPAKMVSPSASNAAGTPGHLSASPYANEGSAATKSAPQLSSAYSALPATTTGSGQMVRQPISENTPPAPVAPVKSAAPAANDVPPMKALTPTTESTPSQKPTATKEIKSAKALPAKDNQPKIITPETTADMPIVMLKKADGSPMKCVVLSEGVRSDGSKVSTVRVIETGEILTMTEQVKAPPSAAKRPSSATEKQPVSSSTRVAESAVTGPAEAGAAMPSDMATARPGLVQRVKDRLNGGASAGSEITRETVISSTPVEESKSVEKRVIAKTDSAVSGPPMMPPDLTPPKPTFVQRVKDRLNGVDRNTSDLPPERVIATTKIPAANAGDKTTTVKAEDMKAPEPVTASKPETPKPAEAVDWHKSWGTEARPKVSSSVAKALETDPLLNQGQYLHPSTAKSGEVGKKAEPLPPIAETKPVENRGVAAKPVAPPSPPVAVASKTHEPSGPPMLVPPVQEPMMPPSVMEAPKVAATPTVTPEPKPVMPLPKVEAPKVEAPKAAVLVPALAEIKAPEVKPEIKLPEPKPAANAQLSISPPIAVPSSVDVKAAELAAVPPLPKSAMRPPVTAMPRPENKPLEMPGLASAASGMEVKPAMAKPAEFSGSGISLLPQAAAASRATPKPPTVDPEVHRAQAVQYSGVLMELLHNAGSPSEREMAAIQLRTADPSTHSLVCQCLLQAAKHDAAPLVRIAAMKSLMEMKVYTPEVKAMLEEAAGDNDPRVREEAKLSLSLMNKPPDVRPASFRR